MHSPTSTHQQTYAYTYIFTDSHRLLQTPTYMYVYIHTRKKIKNRRTNTYAGASMNTHAHAHERNNNHVCMYTYICVRKRACSSASALRSQSIRSVEQVVVNNGLVPCHAVNARQETLDGESVRKTSKRSTECRHCSISEKCCFGVK